ncbi:MAG: flagellar M-ring protein FliF, partial [Alphaproteobacteria bacterium]
APALAAGGGAISGQAATTLLAGPDEAAPALPPESVAGEGASSGAASGDAGGMQADGMQTGRTMAGGEDPVARLRALIEARRDETVQILRSWMEDSEEKT